MPVEAGCTLNVAALDNDIGVIGVAAGASVVAVRVLDRRSSGSYSNVIAGVDYVGANGERGDIANMSLGGSFSQALNDAVFEASKNVKFALAAGNESTNAESDPWASFSNFGNLPIDFAAPGVGVLSTYEGGSYARFSGTSMAVPHVAGILLLGNIRGGGTVSGDPDGNPDALVHGSELTTDPASRSEDVFVSIQGILDQAAPTVG